MGDVVKIMGKAAINVAKYIVDDMAKTSKRLSKNRNMSEQYREQYSSLTTGLLSQSEFLGEQLERLEEEKHTETGESYKTAETPVYNLEIPKSSLNVSDIEQKKRDQAEDASSETDIGTFSLDYWDSKWISLGKLACADSQLYTQIGLYRLIVKERVVLIMRAIDLNRGGISKKIVEIQNIRNPKSKIIQKISSEYDKIMLDVLVVGNTAEDINICRNLEKRMIERYDPIWQRRGSINE